MAEGLTVAGISMHVEGAWQLVSMAALFDASEQVGDDVTLPGVTDGQRAQRRFKTGSVVNLPILLFGVNNVSGTPHADVRTGLYANALYLKANVADPTNSGDGTRTVVATHPGGTITGPAHVIGPFGWVEPEPNSPLWRGVLRLSIPAGSLA